MSIYAKLIRRWPFWGLTAALLFLIAGVILTVWLDPRCLGRWDSLPPLPNGETAKAFTDVIVLNRINVVTDQGNYYSCPYFAEERCWIPIPREVNTPKSNDPGFGLPIMPLDTRTMVAHFRDTGASDNILYAIIRYNGQVAFCVKETGRFYAYFLWICNAGCGILLLMIAADMAALVRSIKAAPQENPSNPSESPISNP